MDWETFGAVKEIISSVAIIASLIFVGYQLRQAAWRIVPSGRPLMIRRAATRC